MDHRALAIVGMRRSGTSSVSLFLNRLGVSFGDEAQLLRKDEFNEEGYWEHKALIETTRRFRMSLNLSSLDSDPVPHDWLDRPATNSMLAFGVRSFQEHFLNIPGPWAWKDPDGSLALPFIYEVTRQADFSPHLLICVRNPCDVVKSEARRMGTPEVETVGSWLAHALGALHGSKDRLRSVLIFDQFLNNPALALASVIEALQLKPTDEQWQNALASVRPSLVHSQSPELAIDELPNLVKRTYHLCCKASTCIDLELEKEIDNLYFEFENYRQMFSRPDLEEATLGAMWVRGDQTQVAQVNYKPTRGWQKITLQTRALPGDPVQIYLYPLPANIWIRNPLWRCKDKSEPMQLHAGTSGYLKIRYGVACISLLHGPDHLIVNTPLVKGPFQLELEMLIESNKLIIGETYRVLSAHAKR